MSGMGSISQPQRVSPALLEAKIKNDQDSSNGPKIKAPAGQSSDAGQRTRAEAQLTTAAPKENTKDMVKLTNSKDSEVIKDSLPTPQKTSVTTNDKQKVVADLQDPASGEQSPLKVAVRLNDQVKMTPGKQQEGQQDQYNNDNKYGQRNINNYEPGYSNTMVARRKSRDEDDEDENGNQRRRRKPAFFQKKPLTILEGAKVGESKTQDMFISSSVMDQRISGAKLEKSVIEQLKEYNMTDVSHTFYEIVYANYNHKEKNGIGLNMQKEIFAEFVDKMQNIDDVLSSKYKRLVRDIIQGSMKAGYDTHMDLKDLVKILISGLMATSPHDDDPAVMVQTVKTICLEIMYGKINIGYNMRDAASYLGSASYTLGLYYRNYQNDVNFNNDLEQRINAAFASAIWDATGDISNYSQAYAKANIENFMTGRQKEDELHNKNSVKNMLLSPLKNFAPLKKVFDR